MNIFRSLLGGQIIFVLGVVNFLMALAILTTCRCIPGSSIFKKFTRNRVYQKFFKVHCYLWWIFWPSVIAHVIFTIMRVGVPF